DTVITVMLTLDQMTPDSPYTTRSFYNDPPTTQTYTLSPTRRSSDLCRSSWRPRRGAMPACPGAIQAMPCGPRRQAQPSSRAQARSEEHTSELQSRENLVCRLLLEKKKIKEDINMSRRKTPSYRYNCR